MLAHHPNRFRKLPKNASSFSLPDTHLKRTGGAKGFRYFLSQFSSQDDIALQSNELSEALEQNPRLTFNSLTEKEIKSRCTALRNLIKDTKLTENATIPAGYTYLLQFIAHDMISSVSPIATSQDPTFISGNGRQAPLRLETLYGTGAEQFQNAYQFTGDFTPRRYLRLGAVAECKAMRDIPRQPIFKDDKQNGGKKSSPTEVLLADPRNDNNGIVSQLTTVFILLHNTILKKLEEHLEPQEANLYSETDNEAAVDRFTVARELITHIYRNIIFKDVMKRILHDSIYRKYTQKTIRFLDKAYDNHDTRPVIEFSFAAFRFGHSMIRSSYSFTDTSGFSITDILSQTSSISSPRSIPPINNWIIQWSHFFDLTSINSKITKVPQSSISIGLNSNLLNSLSDEKILAPVDADGAGGLPYRDFLSGSLVRLRRVGSLITEIKSRNKSILPESALYHSDDSRKKLINAWVAAKGVNFEDYTFLSADPHLLFFILFEAESREIGGGNGGEKLGVLGSILVAESVFGNLRATRSLYESDSHSNNLNFIMKRIITEHLGEQELPRLAHLTKTTLDTMPQLLQFLSEFALQETKCPHFL